MVVLFRLKKRIRGGSNILPFVRDNLMRIGTRYLETAVVAFFIEYLHIVGPTAFIILLIL
jgi:hypothetical protein